MNKLSKICGTNTHIALFGSGNSIHDLSQEDFQIIKSNAFVITLNYAPIHLKGHLNIWSDRKVSDFLQQHYSDKPKDCLLLAQEGRVPAPFKHKIDYWFNRKKENLQGNYTIVWALQLLQKYFPEKSILLFGVDLYAEKKSKVKWYDEYTDYDFKKRGLKYNAAVKLNQCGFQITQFVKKENVYNCNLESRLRHFEKKDWREILKMKILHLCPSSLAGAPVHLSKILNKYSCCESKTILKNQFRNKGMNQLRWDYDIVSPSSQQLDDAIAWADVIHHHRAIYPRLIKNKPSILQFHSPANGYVPEQTHKEFNGRKLVIAQYHPRFYTDAVVVPNMIDIWDTQFQPEEKSKNAVHVFYSWASERTGGWSDKGSKKTIGILNKIKKKYGDQVVIQVMNNRSYADCMAWKRKAHICIDECVTGSYHLQSLEGCAVGAVTFNNIDDQTLGFMSKVNGQNHHPFVKTNLEGLYDKLCYFIEHREELNEKGLLSRKWMEENWNPENLVHHFLRAYSEVLRSNQITMKDAIPQSYPKKSNDNIIINALKNDGTHEKVGKSESLNEEPLNIKSVSQTKSILSTNGKSIQELHQKYTGQDIYIFGTGPSLFNVNPEDYKDKICFGINYSFEIMPYMDYVFVHVIEVYEKVKKLINNEKLILPDTLVRQFIPNAKNTKSPHRIQTSNDKAYIYSLQNPYEKNIHNKHVNLTANTSMFCWSTTTHSAIHLAAYMGARNVYLLGVDYKLYANNKVHFYSKYCSTFSQQKWQANAKHRKGDLWLAKALKEVGINLENLSQQVTSAEFKLIKKATPILGETNKNDLNNVLLEKTPLGTERPKKLASKENEDLLSICITTFNRSKVLLPNNRYLNLLPNCLESIASSVRSEDNIEVIISDFGSTDWILEEWVGSVLKNIPFRIVQVKEVFNKGRGRNIAADCANGNYLFFLDADMVIDRNVLEKGLQFLKHKEVYFPMCFYYLNGEHTKGFWCQGKGNVFISKELFNEAGKWPCPPKYINNLDEDLLFFKWVKQTKAKTVVEKEENFFHQYHPGWSVDLVFKRHKNLIFESPKVAKKNNNRFNIHISDYKKTNGFILPKRKLNVTVNHTEFKVLEHFFYKHHRDLKWEIYTYKIFQHYLKKDCSYIDIGTWIGPTILYATEIGVKSIFGVEANPNTFKMVVENCKLNNIQAEILNLCILDKKGYTQFGNKNKNNSTSDLSSISSIDGSSWEIPTLSLCQYLNHYCPNDWNFVKIDIEGAETYLWKDLEKLSRREHTIIYLSLHPPFWKDKNSDADKLLSVFKLYKIRDLHRMELTLDKLEKMMKSDQVKPNWGTKYGNFFEIILESK